MDRNYELFEKFRDGSPIWRGHAFGLRETRLKLEQLSRTTSNECFALYLPTKEVVARVNVGSSRGGHPKPVVFQIAYDRKLSAARSEVLRRHGYEVISVVGNEAARLILSIPAGTFDLFIVGHDAPEETRKEMVMWLKAKFPATRILALNAPKTPELPGADYNLKLNGPDTLLPIVATACGRGSEQL